MGKNQLEPAPALSKFGPHLFIILLVLVTACLYARVATYDFINFDDDLYVTRNRVVQSGLTWENVKWSFDLFDKERTYWHPLTWLSHMADCELFDLDAGSHHLTSLGIHLINSVLVYLALALLSGSLLPSAIVATLFAIHPLGVDSVAWIAERKNVLSTFFWLLTMIAYGYYAKKPGPTRYGLVLSAFALGLLAKPMLVTLPFVLLLMDVWPMRRLRLKTGQPGETTSTGYVYGSLVRLILEKVPLLLLSAVTILIATLSLETHGITISGLNVPMSLRIENALVSYTKYAAKVLWPQNLSIYYPYPDAIELWKVVGAAAGLILVTGACLKARKAAPWLTIGWFWFLGTLFPVIGLVQGGLWPEMADRWAYVPQIGLFIMLAWGGIYLGQRFPQSQKALLAIAAGYALLLALYTWGQVAVWKNSRTLFNHSLASTGDNYVARLGLGLDFAASGDFEQAAGHYRQANALNPESKEALIGMGFSLLKIGQPDAAVSSFQKAAVLNPFFAKTYYGLGVAYTAVGNIDASHNALSKAIELDAGYAPAYVAMGINAEKLGRPASAEKYFMRAFEMDALDIAANYHLGTFYMQANNNTKAVPYFRNVLKQRPDHVESMTSLAYVFERLGDINAATEVLEEALIAAPDNAMVYYNLGSLKMRREETDAAIAHLKTAIELQPELVEAHNNIGILYARQNTLDKAAAHFKQSIALDPNQIEAPFNLASVMFQSGDIAGAHQQYGQVLDRDPTHSGARRGYEKTSHHLAALDRQIDAVKASRLLDPADAYLSEMLGDLYWQRGKLGDAQQAYKELLSKAPGNLQVRNKLAAAYAQAGAYRQALKEFKQVVALAPASTGTYYNVACMYSRLAETEKALEWIELAVARGYNQWHRIANDADLENLRKTELFVHWMKANAPPGKPVR